MDLLYALMWAAEEILSWPKRAAYSYRAARRIFSGMGIF